MRWPIGLKGAGEIGFDLVTRRAAILITELDTDTGRPVTFGADWGDPDDLAGHRQAFGLVHQGQEHEDLIAESVLFGGGNEKPAILDELHIRGVKGVLILDRQREYALFWTTGHVDS